MSRAQVAVVRLRLATLAVPQVISHASPSHAVIVHPVAGRVTRQASLPPHATSQLLAALHSTWHEARPIGQPPTRAL